MKHYTHKDFETQFPTDDACLDKLFTLRFGTLTCCPHCGVIAAEFMRVEGRKCYACVHCRYQLYPMAGTIFAKSTTPLRIWFAVIFEFAASRNGISAAEIERKFGVAPNTAWRIGMKIREAMKQDFGILLSGVVEADEAYYGGRRRSSNRLRNKTPILGVVQRGGQARVAVTDWASTARVTSFLGATVQAGSTLNTDESNLYHRAEKIYKRQTVKHGSYQFVDGDKYTNTIEHFWGMLKPSLLGTHRAVSKRHLQTYVNEHVWRYNHRGQTLFPLLLDAVAQPV